MVYNKLSLKKGRGDFMKRIVRFIPLLFTPLVLSSCSLLTDGIGNILNGITNFTNNTSSSSDNSSNTSSNSSSNGQNSSSGSSNGSSSSSSSSSQGGQNTNQDEWTIMVYICGTNLESDSRQGGLASLDIEEMRSTPNKPDNVNIVIETGGCSNWHSGVIHGSGTTRITSGELGRYHIDNNNLVKDGKVTNASMGEGSTLESFLDWGFKTYPAKKYGLILWNHGGAMDGVCFDDTFDGGGLTADEIDEAVTNSRNRYHINDKLEFLTYDACIMAIQDLAEVNSHNFKYMLSSQESEVGEGYDYDAWLPTLYANPTTVSTKTVLAEIADTFIEENKNKATDQTQSVFDLSKMTAYKTAFDNFSSGLAGIINTQGKWDDFASILTSSSVQSYADGDYDIYNLADSAKDVEQRGQGKSLLGALKKDNTYSSISSQISALETALNDVVIHEIHQSGTYGCGMCIAAPVNGGIVQSTYNQQTNFRSWYNLCAQYGTWYTSGGGGWGW